MSLNFVVKSQEQLTGQAIKKVKSQAEQLGLKVRSDDEKDLLQLHFVINQILRYVSEEDVCIHRNSHRLGSKDLKMREIRGEGSYCKCCGFVVQEQQLSVCCQPLLDIRNVGQTTFIFFSNLKVVVKMLLMLFIVHSLFSITTNMMESTLPDPFLRISLASKVKNNVGISAEVSCWLGLACILLWGIYLACAVRSLLNKAILFPNLSAAKYTLRIDNMPTGLTLHQVQHQFNRYYDILVNQDTEPANIKHINVVKYNQGKPFYFFQESFNQQKLQQKLNNHFELRQIFIRFLNQRKNNFEFSQNQQNREILYQKFAQNKIQREKIYNQILQNIKRQFKRKDKNTTTTAFVTFNTMKERNFVLANNKNKVLNWLKSKMCCRLRRTLTIACKGQNYQVEASPAPQPQDVVWTAFGMSHREKIKRTFVTYFTTIVLLAISFTLVYWLNVQKQLSDLLTGFIISIIIAIINLIIRLVLQALTFYEKSFTISHHQTSLSIKSTIAQLVNNIIIPFIVNWYLKNQNVFESNGLAQNVILLSMTISFFPFLVRIFDPLYIMLNIYERLLWSPWKRLISKDYNLKNDLLRVKFEAEYEYIAALNLYLFACFFASYQPIVVLFAVMGLGLLFWAQKYALVRQCQRPVPTSDLNASSMHYIVALGTVAFALGNLTWSSFVSFKEQTKILNSCILPNSIAAAISLLIFLLPSYCFENNINSQQEEQIPYNTRRMQFPAEYDRLNPATAVEGVKDFVKYCKQLKKQIKTIKQFQELQNKILNNEVIIPNDNNIFSKIAFKKKSVIMDHLKIIKRQLPQPNNSHSLINFFKVSSPNQEVTKQKLVSSQTMNKFGRQFQQKFSLYNENNKDLIIFSSLTVSSNEDDEKQNKEQIKKPSLRGRKGILLSDIQKGKHLSKAYHSSLLGRNSYQGNFFNLNPYMPSVEQMIGTMGEQEMSQKEEQQKEAQNQQPQLTDHFMIKTSLQKK